MHIRVSKFYLTRFLSMLARLLDNGVEALNHLLNIEKVSK